MIVLYSTYNHRVEELEKKNIKTGEGESRSRSTDVGASPSPILSERFPVSMKQRNVTIFVKISHLMVLHSPRNKENVAKREALTGKPSSSEFPLGR